MAYMKRASIVGIRSRFLSLTFPTLSMKVPINRTLEQITILMANDKEPAINPKTSKPFYYKDNPEAVKARDAKRMYVNGKEVSKKHFPAEGSASLSGVIVDCDQETGLAKNVQSFIYGGDLKYT